MKNKKTVKPEEVKNKNIIKNKKTTKLEEVKNKNIEMAVNKKGDKKTIENHKQAAAHNIEAAKHHMEAAKHYEAGNYEKAAHNTVLAYGHHAIAGEFLSDDAKHHAQAQKETNYHH
jgi:hypothetical protein